MNLRRWNLGFGVGTIFTLIIVYFIYLYSNEKVQSTGELGWKILKFVSKWYLLIPLILFGLFILIIIIWSIIMLINRLRFYRYKKKLRKEAKDTNKKIIDVEFEEINEK